MRLNTNFLFNSWTKGVVVLFFLLLWGYFVYQDRQNSFELLHQDLEKLVINESALVFSNIRAAKQPDKAFSKVVVTDKLKNCLLQASSNNNPGDWDKEMIIHTEGSNVFLRFRFLKKELQYFYRSFVNDELTLLQSSGAQYNSPCNLKDWSVVDELYELDK